MICHLIPDIIASMHFQLQSGVSAPFFGRAVEHVCQVAWLDGPTLGFGTHAPVWASASKPAGSNEYVCQADLAFAGSVGVWTVLDVNFSCGWNSEINFEIEFERNVVLCLLDEYEIYLTDASGSFAGRRRPLWRSVLIRWRPAFTRWRSVALTRQSDLEIKLESNLDFRS